MSVRLTKNLEKIVALATELMADVRKNGLSSPSSSKRIRRSGKDLAAFRKMLKAERRKGVPVEQLATQHGVSKAYIYQLK